MRTFIWIIFILSPFIGSIFVVLALYLDRKNFVNYSVMLALLLSAFGYWFIPNNEMDLTRYFLQLSIYSDMNWDSFVTNVILKNILVIQVLFFYLISKTNNFHLLPAIVIFVTYFCTFYMIIDYSNKKNIKSKKMMKTIIIVMMILPFPLLVSNIRNILSFIIFIFAVYRELGQNKKNLLTYLLYIVPVFIHISAIALLILRLIQSFYERHKILVGGLIVMITLIISKVNYIIQNTFFSKIRIISSFFIKADNYINNTESNYANYLKDSLVMNLQKYYFLIVVLFFLILNLKIRREIENNKEEVNTRRLINFMNLLILLILGTAPILLTVYIRFVYPVIILSYIPILNINKLNINKYNKKKISIIIFLLTMIGIIHQSAFLYKMTDILKMLQNVITKSLLNMFFM